MPSVGLAIRALVELGPQPLFYFARYQLAVKSGWLRKRTPVHSWDSRPLAYWLRLDVPATPGDYLKYRMEAAPRFFFAPEQDLKPALQTALKSSSFDLLAEAHALLRGNFRLFGGEPVGLGFPPDWNVFPPMINTSLGQIRPFRQHWSSYSDQQFPADVKYLWELSRFGWAYPLARAYRFSQDPQFAAGFWDLLAAWRSQNPPNMGPQWISAQEVALRMLALVFGLYAFWPWLQQDAEKVVALAGMIAEHAERVVPSLDYARAQANNHLLSEGAALYTAGLLFPEFKHAERWKRLGRRALERGIARQFMNDGGYRQFSTNYHRLALQVCCWAVQLARLHEDPLAPTLIKKLRAGVKLLQALVDPRTGKAPNWGHNDGSNGLPLACGGHDDYRPALQAAWGVLDGERLFDAGPWDETLVWLGLPQLEKAIAPDSPTAGQRADLCSFPYAGLHLMGGKESRAFLRCARFCSRPAHSDQLNLDIWWRGVNFVRDAGTYLYNAPPPWENGLAAARVHNGPVVNDQEPMLRAGRFLWLRWAQGRVLARETDVSNAWEMVVAEHSGYPGGIIVRRTVLRLGGSSWHVCDDILGQGTSRVRLAWLLPDVDWRKESDSFFLADEDLQAEVRVQGADMWRLIRAGEGLAGDPQCGVDERLGWYSPTYGQKIPALSLCLQAERSLPLQVQTTFLFGADESSIGEVEWHAPGEGRLPLSRLHYAGQDLEF